MKKIFPLFIFCSILLNSCLSDNLTHEQLRKLFKWWADTLGKKLFDMGMKITKPEIVEQSFKDTKFVEETGENILDSVVSNFSKMMSEKIGAVRRIMKEAEKLSQKRPRQVLEPDSQFDYYNADNLTDTYMNLTLVKVLEEIRKKHKQYWDKTQFAPLELPPTHFRSLPMVEHPNFEDPVNVNYSIVRVSKSIYYRETDILNDVRWSESLDRVFSENFKKDPTLLWQYLATSSGFMRLYPAVKWSEEQYDQTFDHRLRNWYTEAITSSKDIIILLDKSGSMLGLRRTISKQIINNILDTLADNDYVNIYTYAQHTQPLVKCFNDTLMQAHEENLRLLRESLGKYQTKCPGNMTIAFERAFRVLKEVRNNRGIKGRCNQAIVLITEGVDYDYKAKELFKVYNKVENNQRPVRVFTYLIGTEQSDARELEWIACSNMGYYVNVSTTSEIREKVVKYIDVFSRTLNMDGVDKPEPVWTGTYIDLADRRLANWLWDKVEGNRQRDILIDYTKRMIEREKLMYTWEDNIVLQKHHDYEIYETKRNYTYVTTVSLPVYDLRPNSTKVLGAAAVDIPISYIKQKLMSYRIGVNGYAFIVNHNGLIVVHPDHRTEFQNIPKPTFNRVDLTEVELVNDNKGPREFDRWLLRLRKDIVLGNTGNLRLNLKTHLDNMKRILFLSRRYYFTPVPDGDSPFRIVVALPYKYGLNRVEYRGNVLNSIHNKITGLFKTQNWTIHPEWRYCKSYGGVHFQSAKEELMAVIKNIQNPDWNWPAHCDKALMNILINDAKVTEWFEKTSFLSNEYHFIDNNSVTCTFLATHSGLTRWKQFRTDNEPFYSKHDKAIDEVWYKRAVEYYYVKSPSFVYSVPFESLGFDKTTPVTATAAIFRKEKSKETPVAVVGYQFHHVALHNLFRSVTNSCVEGGGCKVVCHSNALNCYVLDNNAYIVVSDDLEDSGNFFGDVRPDIMHELVTDKIYNITRMFDYQAICYIDKKKATEPPSSDGIRLGKIIDNLVGILKWLIVSLIYFIELSLGKTKIYQSVKSDTLGYNRLQLNKTVPTPCDHDFYLFTLIKTSWTETEPDTFLNMQCKWPYMVQPIPNSNLILLVVNALCPKNTSVAYQYTPDPSEISSYNMSHPCFIATMNNFYKKSYIKCVGDIKKEKELNVKNPEKYCGSFNYSLSSPLFRLPVADEPLANVKCKSNDN